jgi:hypothetical protein
MPISMKELDQTYRRTYRRLIIGIFIFYGTFLLVVLSLLIGSPRVAGWMSEATRAEPVGMTTPSASEPLRLTGPARRVRTVKAD